jgi:signal transduction histidine kinase
MVASRAFDDRGQSPGWPAVTRVPHPRAVGDTHVCTHYHALHNVRRSLHDHVGSSLAGLTMSIDLARRALTADRIADRGDAVRLLADLREDVTALLEHVRHLITDSDPRPHDGSVAVALRSMISGMSHAAGDTIAITLEIDPRITAVPEDVAWAAFWIVREAMTNVYKHSSARACAVSLCVRHEQLHVQVRDNGVGLGAARPGSAGMVNMRSRATDLGGWCSVERGSPRGVVVTALLPLLESVRPREVR